MRSRTLVSVVSVFLIFSLVGAAVPVGAESGTSDHTECSFPITETDATGEAVTVDERPDQIVVLQASAAQTAWELDAQDRVVGAPSTPYTAYLDGIEEKENVVNVDEFTVNREAVVELEADLILAPNVIPDETVEQLREEADQTVFKFEFGTSLEFVAEKTELTGQLIGSCAEAAETNDEYWDRIETVREGTDAYEAPRVLHYTDGFTAGSGTFIDEIITTAGGVNVAAENGIEGYGELNEEALVEWNPEVIVVSDDGPGVPETAAFESTFAVENDQIAVVNGNYLSQPAPRIAIALEEVAAALATAERDTETEPAAAEDEVETEPAAAEDEVETEPAAAEDQPGFGVVAALLALLAVLFARR